MVKMRIIPLTMAVLPLAFSVESPSLHSSQNPKIEASGFHATKLGRQYCWHTSLNSRFSFSLGNNPGLKKLSGFENISVACGAYNPRSWSAPLTFLYKLGDSSLKVVGGVKVCATSQAFNEEEKTEPVKEGTNSESGSESFQTVENPEARGDSQVEGGEIDRKLEGGVGGGGEGNFGGSGGSGWGKGGDEGSQSSGGGEEESKKKAGKMSMSQKFTLAYAALLGVGGVIGYVKSGSSKSLVSGALSAFLLYYVYAQLPANPVFASSVGLGVSAVLLIVMGSRFKRSGKIFPAGVVSLVSLIMTGGYFHGILRGSHA